MKNNSLLIFTINFPYGNGESFLINEINILSSKFKTIYVFPIKFLNQESEYNLPTNVEVVKFNMFQPYNRVKILIKNFRLICSIYLTEFFYSKSKIKYISQFLHTFNNLTHKISASDNFYNLLKQMQINKPVAYSYWFNQWPLILSIVKAKHQHLNIYTRIHGMDVYEEQHYRKNFFYQFRVFQLKRIKKVFAISSHGKLHLERANRVSVNKVVLSRLGTKDFSLNKMENLNFFRVVSCSSFLLYKRVDLIVDILSQCNIKVEWVHFGDGELKDDILKKAKLLPSQISFKWMRFKPNSFVMDYYQNNHVDLFINVSSSEGIPVSIMEALSFGIPVIATDVGGVSEIVNVKTGFLIDKNFETKTVAQIIEEYSVSPDESKLRLRQSARLFWEQNYSADVNYNKLSLELI